MKTSDMTKIEQIRRRKKLRKLRNAAISVFVLAMVLCYFTGIFGSSLAILGEVVDSVKITLMPGKGWPVSLSLANFQRVQPLGGGFVASGKQDVVVYSSTAGELKRFQPGYANPEITAGNTRFCVYNRSGKELQIHSRTRTLATKTYDYAVLLAEMSPGGTLAVATKSDRYTSEIHIYNNRYNEIYTYSFASEYPSAITFANNDKDFAVTTITPKDGALGTTLYLLNIASDAETATFFVPDALALQIHYLTGNRLLVVYDNFIAVYNSQTGEQICAYSYELPIQAACTKNQNTALLLGSSAKTLILLNDSLEVLAIAQVDTTAQDVLIDREHAYVLTENSVETYTLTGEGLGSTALNAQPLKLIGAKEPLVLTAAEVCALK
ncbi:MAG: DUF5711 family protein [Oscillospiraceae bacterium]|nr:DUF5711 family protein [Oscillospiraceae bacterium]